MKYFFQVDITYVPKNAAYKQLQDLFNLINGTLIDGELELQCFNDLLQGRIDKINQENRRCKDIAVDQHEWDGTTIEYNGTSVIAYLYQVNHDITTVFKDG